MTEKYVDEAAGDQIKYSQGPERDMPHRQFMERFGPVIIDLAPEMSYCDKYTATAQRDDGRHVHLDFPPSMEAEAIIAEYFSEGFSDIIIDPPLPEDAESRQWGYDDIVLMAGLIEPVSGVHWFVAVPQSSPSPQIACWRGTEEWPIAGRHTACVSASGDIGPKCPQVSPITPRVPL